MAQSAQQRQRALERQAKKRKEKAAALRHQHGLAPGSHGELHVAKTWPVVETLLTRDWNEPAALVEALVARRSTTGRVAVGVFLVDLGCLGVKNAYYTMFPSFGEYERTLRQSFLSTGPKIPGNLNLIAKIVREAVAYAADLGFAPNRDYPEAAQMLAGADPDASPVLVPLGGEDGKPLFINGPHDNTDAILAHLDRRLGRDGYHFLLQVGGTMAVLIDDYYEDEDDDEDDFLDQTIDELSERQ